MGRLGSKAAHDEDAAFGFIVMQNGATITLDATWALNTIEPIPEGSVQLMGSKAGAQIKGGVSINKGEYGRLIEKRPDMSAGGVAFYDGVAGHSRITEQMRWYDAIENDTDPVVLPEQACWSPRYSRPYTPPHAPASRYTSIDVNIRPGARTASGLIGLCGRTAHKICAEYSWPA